MEKRSGGGVGVEDSEGGGVECSLQGCRPRSTWIHVDSTIFLTWAEGFGWERLGGKVEVEDSGFPALVLAPSPLQTEQQRPPRRAQARPAQTRQKRNSVSPHPTHPWWSPARSRGAARIKRGCESGRR